VQASSVVRVDGLRDGVVRLGKGGKGLIEVEFVLQDAVDALGEGVLVAVIGIRHARQEPMGGERSQEVMAAVLGGFNRSSKHFPKSEGFDDQGSIPEICEMHA
jgi:hypothetical protein